MSIGIDIIMASRRRRHIQCQESLINFLGLNLKIFVAHLIL